MIAGIFVNSGPLRHKKSKTKGIIGFEDKNTPYISSQFYSNSLKEKCR